MFNMIEDINRICGMEILVCIYMNDNIKIHIGDSYVLRLYNYDSFWRIIDSNKLVVVSSMDFYAKYSVQSLTVPEYYPTPISREIYPNEFYESTDYYESDIDELTKAQEVLEEHIDNKIESINNSISGMNISNIETDDNHIYLYLSNGYTIEIFSAFDKKFTNMFRLEER